MSIDQSVVPPVLRQKCAETRDLSSIFSCTFLPVLNGKIITWKGKDTGYFWTVDESNKFSLFEHNGTADARVKFVHQFDISMSVNSVIYYPASDKYHGIAVAVANVTSSNDSYVAYFSLVTNRFVKCFNIPLPITCLYSVYDGTTPCSTFDTLCKQFRTGWSDILLVGCQHGFAYLTRLYVGELVENEILYESRGVGNASTDGPPLVRARHMIPLTTLFHNDKMFVCHTDDGRQICLEKEQVSVSALHYLEKSKCVMIGFSFGGIVFVSLTTSKINTFYYGDGIVRFFAVQEPEEDPRPILYYWICLHNVNKGTLMVLCTINFPKDEVNTKDPSEYTYLEPVAYPVLRWAPDECDEMLSVRTLQIERAVARDDTADRYSMLRVSPLDTSLMLMVWQKNTGDGVRIHGSLFDLNAFYAKRLSGRVIADNTPARQFPYLSRFSTGEYIYAEPAMDALGLSAFRYPPPAFLKKSIDQLFYPSANFLTFNLLTTDRLAQMKVQPLQLQLIGDLADNIVTYFDEPTDPSKWICALGLANSAPSANINEERACLLRVLIHTFLPGILRLIGASTQHKENLRFIQRWIWREIELTKTKFDELCSPMFSGSSEGMSPEACAYVHQACAFFRRACSVFEALCNELDAFDGKEDDEWKSSIALQYKASRQVEIFSVGITFGLWHNLLPLKEDCFRVHVKCAKSLTGKLTRAKRNGAQLNIYKLVSEIIEQNPDEQLWNGQNAESWFVPPDFTHFLPVLLLMNLTEETKITLLGYYFLECDAVSATMNDVTPTDLFDKCVSVFMQDQISTSLQAQIRRMWFDDEKTAAGAVGGRPPSALSDDNGSVSESAPVNFEEELYYLPLTTKKEILHVKSEYMKLEHGIHKFNRDVIKKRRYNLIIEPPLSIGPEPEFVVTCREEIARIQKQFPWLALKVEPLPESIIQKFRERIALDKKEANEKIVHVAARRSHMENIPSQSRKRKLDPLAAVEEVANKSDIFEELPLTIATPAKRPRPILSSAATTATPTSAKVWSRISRVVQTPIALVEPEALRSPPRSTQPPRTPVSILKSNKKRTEGGAKSRLRFQNAFQTEHIPTRSEVLMEETRNGSFSAFGNNESPLSPVSRTPEAEVNVLPDHFTQSSIMTTPVKKRRTAVPAELSASAKATINQATTDVMTKSTAKEPLAQTKSVAKESHAVLTTKSAVGIPSSASTTKSSAIETTHNSAVKAPSGRVTRSASKEPSEPPSEKPATPVKKDKPTSRKSAVKAPSGHVTRSASKEPSEPSSEEPATPVKKNKPNPRKSAVKAPSGRVTRSASKEPSEPPSEEPATPVKKNKPTPGKSAVKVPSGRVFRSRSASKEPSEPPSEEPATPVKKDKPPPKTPTKSPSKSPHKKTLAPIDSVHKMVTRSKSPHKPV